MTTDIKTVPEAREEVIDTYSWVWCGGMPNCSEHAPPRLERIDALIKSVQRETMIRFGSPRHKMNCAYAVAMPWGSVVEIPKDMPACTCGLDAFLKELGLDLMKIDRPGGY